MHDRVGAVPLEVWDNPGLDNSPGEVQRDFFGVYWTPPTGPSGVVVQRDFFNAADNPAMDGAIYDVVTQYQNMGIHTTGNLAAVNRDLLGAGPNEQSTPNCIFCTGVIQQHIEGMQL